MSSASRGDQRWVVDRAGLSLRGVLELLQVSSDALVDGRVFVDQCRMGAAQQGQALAVGSEVLVYRERAAAQVAVLSEAHGVIAVAKPAGISTQPDHRGVAHCLLGELAQLIDEKPEALHALHRLDREVSGVVLVSRTAKATAWVEQAREQRQFHRRYLAIASGHLAATAGTWEQAIGQGKRPGLRRVAGPNAKAALTRYQRVGEIPARQVSLLIVEPATGRTHQIRVHAAHAGVPLLGDGDYGGQRRVVHGDGSVHALSRIALHALQIELPRLDGNNWNIVAPPPAELVQLWQSLGGQAADLASLSDRPWL
jgi:RluA family pseudouridine synthase